MKRGKNNVRNALRIYGGFLSKSWKTTWSHKSLWLIAAVAGLANTGAIFSRVMNKMWKVQPADKISLDSISQSVESIPWILNYAKAILTLDSIRISITLFILVLLAVACILLVTASQQIVLHHAKKTARTKKIITLDNLRKELHHLHIFRIFSIDAAVFLSIILLQLLATIPLVYLLSSSLILNAAVYVGMFLILLPLGFIINSIGMFTLINIVRRDEGIVDAIVHSWRLVKNHWLVIFEMAIMLYIINIAVTLGIKITLMILAIPFGMLTFASLGTGNIWLLASLTVVGSVVAVIIVALAAGALTMFNYSVWTHLANRFDKFPFISSLETLAVKMLVK